MSSGQTDLLDLVAGLESSSWRSRALEAVHSLAMTGRTFQACDVAALAGEPLSQNSWGPLMLAAARSGVIVAAGYEKSRRTTVCGSAVRCWTGTR